MFLPCPLIGSAAFSDSIGCVPDPRREYRESAYLAGSNRGRALRALSWAIRIELR
jgi:hypothetical protein